jgi:hypothetical protein
MSLARSAGWSIIALVWILVILVVISYAAGLVYIPVEMKQPVAWWV